MAPTASGSQSLQLGEAGGHIPNSEFKSLCHPYLLSVLCLLLTNVDHDLAFPGPDILDRHLN